jgi:hypothetical protein
MPISLVMTLCKSVVAAVFLLFAIQSNSLVVLGAFCVMVINVNSSIVRRFPVSFDVVHYAHFAISLFLLLSSAAADSGSWTRWAIVVSGWMGMLVFHGSVALHHDDLRFGVPFTPPLHSPTLWSFSLLLIDVCFLFASCRFLQSRQLFGWLLLLAYTLLLFADPTGSALPGFDIL